MHRGFKPGPTRRQAARTKPLQLQLHFWGRNPLFLAVLHYITLVQDSVESVLSCRSKVESSGSGKVESSAFGMGAKRRLPFPHPDRKSTRLNSSHLGISYAVFCLKKTTDPASAKALALCCARPAGSRSAPPWH